MGYDLRFSLLSILILFSSFLTSFGFPLFFPSLFFLGTPFIQSMFSMLRSIIIISIASPFSHIFFSFIYYFSIFFKWSYFIFSILLFVNNRVENFWIYFHAFYCMFFTFMFLFLFKFYYFFFCYLIF